MSVMISHIDFDSQDIGNHDEAEMEKEDAKQQMEIQQFLENELNDEDLLDDTYNTNFAQSNHGNNIEHNNITHKQTNNLNPNYYNDGNNYLTHSEIVLNSSSTNILNGQYTQHQNEIQNDGHSFDHLQIGNSFNDPSSHYFGIQQFQEENNEAYQIPNYPSTIEGVSYPTTRESAKYPSTRKGDPLDISNGSYTDIERLSNGIQINVPQIQNLYELRGRRIEELQQQLESKSDEFAKEKRVSQHKLNMITAEKDGYQTSNEQLQKLLQEHKHEINSLEQQIITQQRDNDKLNENINELNEKLNVTDSTIDTLQHQLNELNKSDSMSKARAHHETMLATIREKHKNEILNLNEKIDDMKQALAWKTEDVNRYKEMLDTNSSASEIGILRLRLSAEERKRKEQAEKTDSLQRDNIELVEQIKIYNDLLKDRSNQFSSTPYNAASAMMSQRKVLDFKTPISSKYQSTKDDPPTTPLSGDSAMRKELIKALSTNHEKRQEILMLREKLGKQDKYSEDNQVNKSINQSIDLLKTCKNCESFEEKLKSSTEEVSTLQNENKCLKTEKEKLNENVTEMKTNMAEMKTNMAEMIKSFDIEKTKLHNTQNNAVLKMIDDSKVRIKNELNEIHDKEISTLHDEMHKLNTDLIYAKEEYIKLSEELKLIQTRVHKEYENTKKIEIEELKIELQNNFIKEKKQIENNLTSKHFTELENEKKKILETLNIEYSEQAERDLILAKVDLMHEYEQKKVEEIKLAVEEARNNWKCNCNKEEISKYGLEKESLLQDIKKLEEKVTSSIKMNDNFKLKEKQWLETEANLKSQIKKNESNTSQTSLIFEDIMNNTDKKLTKQGICKQCQYLIEKFDKIEKQFMHREGELSVLLDKTTEQLHQSLKNNSLDNSGLQNSYNEDQSIFDRSKYFSPETNKRIDSLLKSKMKLWTIKEQSFKTEIEKLTESLSKWKERYEEVENTLRDTRNENIEFQNNFLKYKTEVEDLVEELKTSKSEIERLTKDFEQREIELIKQYEEMIENAVLIQQKKLHNESTKLKEDVIKAENELIKTHLLSDLQNNENNIQEINILKKDYDTKIYELKQGFRDKLSQINEMKKKWVIEEEEKREKLKVMLSAEYSQQLQELETTNQNKLTDYFQKWQINMLSVKDQHELQVVKFQNQIKTLKDELEKEKENYKIAQQDYHKILDEVTKKHQKEVNVIEEKNKNEIENVKKTLECEFEILLQQNIKKMEKDNEEHVKEAYEKGVMVSKDNSHVIENIRQLYLQTLQEINNDVMNHIDVTKQQAASQIKEAASRERKQLIKKIKLKQQQSKRNTENEENLIPTKHQSLHQSLQRNTQHDIGTFSVKDIVENTSSQRNNKLVNSANRLPLSSAKDNSNYKHAPSNPSSKYKYTPSSDTASSNGYLMFNKNNSLQNVNSKDLKNIPTSSDSNESDTVSRQTGDGELSLDLTLKTSLCELPVSLKKANDNALRKPTYTTKN